MTRTAVLLGKYFYLFMSLVIAAVVVYGFSHTVDTGLIHAVPVRPGILYLHAAVFSGWVIFFILQSALVRTHNMGLHRCIGWFGAAIPLLGVSTAITMSCFKTHYFHSTDEASGLMFSFLDMTAFTPYRLRLRFICGGNLNSTDASSWSPPAPLPRQPLLASHRPFRPPVGSIPTWIP
jgi:hypothetical protein